MSLVVGHPIVLALVLSPKGGTRTRKGIDMSDHESLDVYWGGLEFVAWAYGHCRSLEGPDRHARDQPLRASQSIPLNMDHLTDRVCGVRVLVAPPGLVDPWLPVNPWLAPWATVLAPLRGLASCPSGARKVVVPGAINGRSGGWRRAEPQPEHAARSASLVECGSGGAGVRGHCRDGWDGWNRTSVFSCGAEPIGWLHGISPARPTEEGRPRTTSPRSGFVQPLRRANRRQPARSL